MSIEDIPLGWGMHILVEELEDASKEKIQHALAIAVEMNRDLSVSHTRREIWKQLARLLRKQLKQY